MDVSSIAAFDQVNARINRGINCGRMTRKVLSEYLPHGVATFPVRAVVRDTEGNLSRIAFAIELVNARRYIYENRSRAQRRSMGYKASFKNIDLVNLTADLVITAGTNFRKKLTVHSAIAAVQQLSGASYDMLHSLNYSEHTTEREVMLNWHRNGPDWNFEDKLNTYKEQFNLIVDTPELTEEILAPASYQVLLAAYCIRPDVRHYVRKFFPLRRRHWIIDFYK